MGKRGSGKEGHLMLLLFDDLTLIIQAEDSSWTLINNRDKCFGEIFG